MNIQHNYRQEEEEQNDIPLESEKAFKQKANAPGHIFPTIDLEGEEENASAEEEIASEQDSETLRDKKRQEETRRMIEQAKMKRQKCIDDSSSSSGGDMNGSINYNQPIQIEEGDNDFIDFPALTDPEDATEEKNKE